MKHLWEEREKMEEQRMSLCTVMESPIGLLEVMEENGAVTRICFMQGDAPAQPESQPESQPDTKLYSQSESQLESQLESQSMILQETVRQLQEYFAGERTEFSIPLAPQGTEFQKKVWKALLRIPYGETRSYGEIAQMVGNSKASRAVGMANHNNPIPILIPCHRVIGKNGKLTGYAGGLEKKTALLELERSGKQSI